MREKQAPKGMDHSIVPKVIRAYSQANVWLYRKTSGMLGGKWRIGSAFPWGLPVILVTTVGRKSGLPRTTPLLYLQDGENYVVVASQGGLPRHPLWYLNMRSNADVELQDRAFRGRFVARTAEGDERRALWQRLEQMYPDFNQYQEWTEREIPVVVLEPARN